MRVTSRPITGRVRILVGILPVRHFAVRKLPIPYTAYRVSHVNAHPQSLGHLEKLFFQFTCFFRVCAYLSTGFAVYRMVLDHKQTFDGTLTPGLRYHL